MRSAPATVVVDATFLKHLKNADSIIKIEAAARAAHLEVSPSILNVIEALKHTNPQIRLELLEALQKWSRNEPLNPWPIDLLRLAGEALLRDKTEFTIAAGHLDQLLLRPPQLDTDHAEVVAFLTKLEADFANAYLQERTAFQALLRSEGKRNRWPTLRSFLETDGSDLDINRDPAAALWELAKLPGEALPVATLKKSEVWSLALDALAAAAYTRSIRINKQRNPPGFVDLFQLLYMARHRRARIFVTDDESLYDAATAILIRRYPNTRVLRSGEFLSLSA